jgi:phosphate transport system ATP-binding protein
MRDMDDRVEWALMRAALWDEVKGKLRQSGTACPAASSSACASRAASPSSPRCCCSTSPARRSIRSRRAKIEELIHELKSDYTVVIVTHNMQQAARVSDFTAYMYLGELIEYGVHRRSLHQAEEEADRGLHHRQIRIAAADSRLAF